MNDHRPHLIVPRTSNLASAFDDDMAAIQSSKRAHRTGVLIIAPRNTEPNALAVSCQMWPCVLTSLGVTRIAVVLSVQSYMASEPVLRMCARCMRRHRLGVAYFHEGHLDSDVIDAWFERRKPERRVTSDAMFRLAMWYRDRGDARGAIHARELAEALL